MSETTLTFSLSKKGVLTLTKKIVFKTDDQNIIDHFVAKADKHLDKVEQKKKMNKM